MKIRTLLLTLMMCLIGTASTIGQEVLLKKNPSVSGFISIEPMVSNYKGKITYNQSASAAVLLNQTFYFGGFSDVLIDAQLGNFSENIDDFEPSFGAIGLMLGTLIKPEKLVHFDVRLKIGMGALRSNEPISISDFDCDYRPVFVAQPSAGIELNVSRFFKVNMHAGYRYVSDIDRAEFDKGSLNGMTGQIGLVFGWFGQKKSKEAKAEMPDAKNMSL